MERALENLVLLSRWLLAPMYLGLIASLFVLLARFALKVAALVEGALTYTVNETIVAVLALIDLSLTANLVLLVVFVGWESFVSPFNQTSQSRPVWMQKLGFSDLKIKLLTSILAISAIKVLEDFMHVEEIDSRNLAWSVGIHLAFVASALVLAVVDRMSAAKH